MRFSHVVAIDDCILSLSAFVGMLKYVGLTPKPFNSLKQAKQYIEGLDGAALIVLDNNLKADQTGIEYATECLVDRPDDRMILVTGLAPEVEIPRNIIRVVDKPIYNLPEFMELLSDTYNTPDGQKI